MLFLPYFRNAHQKKLNAKSLVFVLYCRLGRPNAIFM